VLFIGSLARAALGKQSDLDVWLVRRAGFMNGISVCIFAMSERLRAFANNFPLDLHVLDNEHNFKSKERPVVIYGKRQHQEVL